MTNDWKAWDGTPWGYEGFLVDNYYALLAVLVREGRLQKGFFPRVPRISPATAVAGRSMMRRYCSDTQAPSHAALPVGGSMNLPREDRIPQSEKTMSMQRKGGVLLFLALAALTLYIRVSARRSTRPAPL